MGNQIGMPIMTWITIDHYQKEDIKQQK
ncbi:uncharacterized protein METZ01_LOCUS161292 [marine metagenome]|uniref:Uncharacterized protein n=1 Tax=marine metagenome TaxID=408172 RepID=A0A382B3W5_9ZZZZ